MFIKLTNTDGKHVWVNTDNIAFFRENGEKSVIVFSSPDNERLVVNAALKAEEFADMLEAAGTA